MSDDGQSSVAAIASAATTPTSPRSPGARVSPAATGAARRRQLAEQLSPPPQVHVNRHLARASPAGGRPGGATTPKSGRLASPLMGSPASGRAEKSEVFGPTEKLRAGVFAVGAAMQLSALEKATFVAGGSRGATAAVGGPTVGSPQEKALVLERKVFARLW